MNSKDEPATENQLSHLRRFGFESDHRLTKREAARLTGDFGAHSERQALASEKDNLQLSILSAYRLRLAVEDAKRAVAETPGHQFPNPLYILEMAINKRQEFWADTCSDTDKVHLVPPQALALHKKHGLRFAKPTADQVQAILDSLDAAMPSWDRDHPELFYETLELNFPDLFLHHVKFC